MIDTPTNFSIKRWPEGERPREKDIDMTGWLDYCISGLQTQMVEKDLLDA